MVNDKQDILIIVGPTAVGKTELTIRLANALHGEIVSADSMQIYKFMEIGSAKPTPEERSQAVHYLVDVIDPGDSFSVAEYAPRAREAIRHIAGKGMLPIVSGGTGLYVNSILYNMTFADVPENKELRERLLGIAEAEGNDTLHSMLKEYDPAAAARIHPNNRKKIIRALEAAMSGHPIPSFEESFHPDESLNPFLIGLKRDREVLYERINRRVDQMIEAGLLTEIRSLLDRGLNEQDLSMKGIGYKELIGYLHGNYDLDTAIDLVKRNTRHYAKRQMTWFRRYPDIHWFDLTDDAESTYRQILEETSQWLKRRKN